MRGLGLFIGMTNPRRAAAWTPALIPGLPLWADPTYGLYSDRSETPSTPAINGGPLGSQVMRTGQVAVSFNDATRPLVDLLNGCIKPLVGTAGMIISSPVVLDGDFTLYVSGTINSNNSNFVPLGAASSSFGLIRFSDNHLYLASDTNGSFLRYDNYTPTGPQIIRVRRSGNTVRLKGKSQTEAVTSGSDSFSINVLYARPVPFQYNGDENNKYTDIICYDRYLSAEEDLKVLEYIFNKNGATL